MDWAWVTEASLEGSQPPFLETQVLNEGGHRGSLLSPRPLGPWPQGSVGGALDNDLK